MRHKCGSLVRQHTTAKHCLVLATLCVAIVVTATTTAHAADSFNTTLSMPSNNLGLVAHWTFDGPTISGTSVTDVSGQGNTGTLEYSPPPVPGVEGQALSLNGSNQYVNCGTNNPTFNFASTTSFTESIWAYPTRVNGNWQAVFQVGRNLGLGNYQGIWLSGGNQWVFGSTGGGNLGTVYATQNKWANITVVHTATSKAIYINGVLNATSGGDYINGDLGGSLCGIGSWGAEYFAGSVDDLRVYNRALSPYEITQLYNAGTATHQNATINPSDLQQGLVGHWTFDGPTISGTTVKDVSGNSNNGTLVNGPTTIAGVLGQALSFNGTSQYVNVPSTASFDVSSLTLAGWVKLSSNTDGEIIEWDIPGYERWAIRSDRGGSGYFNFVTNTSGGFNVLNSITTTASSVGKWIYVVGTFDGQFSRIYINGALQNTYNYGGPVTLDNGNGYPLGIGTDPINGGPYLSGSIDDVRIYNRALPASQITQLYDLGLGSHQNATVNPPNLQSGLVGHWTFDGPTISGTTVKDVSGSGNNGTMVNGPTPVAGVLGQALSFNGTSQYMEIPGINAFSFTTSMWIKTTKTDDNIFFQAQNNTPLWYMEVGATTVGGAASTQFNVLVRDDLGNLGGPYNSGVTVSDGKWHLIVAERDVTTGTVRLYVDGTAAGSFSYPYSDAIDTIGGPIVQNTIPHTGDIYAGSGSIDDVRIYNRALSASEVKQLYNLGR